MENKKSNVLIIGAGRTGRGMLGEMFFSEGGFNLAFADIDSTLVKGLRRQNWYTMEQKDLLTGAIKKTLIENFSVFNTIEDHEQYLECMADSDIILTALFPDAFDQVSADLAEGINRRAETDKPVSVSILLGSNFVSHYDYFYPRIYDRLTFEGKKYFDTYVSLLAINANRKVVFDLNNKNDLFSLTGDNKPLLMVDNKFKHKPEPMPSFFCITNKLDTFMAEKIWSANLQHCSFGFLGSYQGYQVINQAVRDKYIRKIVYYAWHESREALKIEYGFPIPNIETTRDEYRKFSSPYFEDKISRIARDPIRKLSRHDRFIGPALLCLKHNIIPFFILKCAAYGFLYDEKNDISSVRLQQRIQNETIENVILEVCGLELDKDDDRLVFELLLANYKEIRDECPIELEESK